MTHNVDEGKAIKDYHKWSVDEEIELLVAMKLAKAAGHKSRQGFKTKGIPFMLDHIKKKFPGTNMKEVSIKNHLKQWRKYLTAILDLRSISGVGWCDVTKSFTCSEERWKYFAKVCHN